MILVSVEVTLGAGDTWMWPLRALRQARLVHMSSQYRISRPVLETKQTVYAEPIDSARDSLLGVSVSMCVKLVVWGLLLVTTRHHPCV